MKRPEKIQDNILRDHSMINGSGRLARNQTCDEWEAYLKEFLPSVMEIQGIIKHAKNSGENKEQTLEEYMEIEKIAKAISKRLKGAK